MIRKDNHKCNTSVYLVSFSQIKTINSILNICCSQVDSPINRFNEISKWISKPMTYAKTSKAAST